MSDGRRFWQDCLEPNPGLRSSIETVDVRCYNCSGITTIVCPPKLMDYEAEIVHYKKQLDNLYKKMTELSQENATLRLILVSRGEKP